ncbi:LysR family transcriptional regulator [Pelagibius sp. Alg239-R121]|uniref:LysR family transcriptional regulator n=1 Tax=Pelagibius sp. Alg239-R121 TaxID=2993448 RepID=UPI0024A656C4|nr:LysR family transcriptional regulator [Pelagibius sp. Alg239-R121]
MITHRSSPLGKLSKTDLHHLAVFATVVEAGGFSAAQVSLNVATSTISRQISELESRLGMRLCQRGRGGFRITEQGSTVFNAAKQLFAALENFRGTIDASRGRLTGQLSLAIIENWVADERSPLASALAQFKSLAPEVQIDIYSLAPDEIELAVFDGRADIGIGVFHQHRPGLIYETIGDDPVELYCGKGHPLFEQVTNGLTTRDLKSAELVRRAYLSEEQVAPRTAHLASTAAAHQVEGVAFMILSGSFVGYLPVHYAARWVKEGRMRSLLPHRHRLNTKIEIVTKRGSNPSTARQTFLEILERKPVGG